MLEAMLEAMFSRLRLEVVTIYYRDILADLVLRKHLRSHFREFILQISFGSQQVLNFFLFCLPKYLSNRNRHDSSCKVKEKLNVNELCLTNLNQNIFNQHS